MEVKGPLIRVSSPLCCSGTKLRLSGLDTRLPTEPACWPVLWLEPVASNAHWGRCSKWQIIGNGWPGVRVGVRMTRVMCLSGVLFHGYTQGCVCVCREPLTAVALRPGEAAKCWDWLPVSIPSPRVTHMPCVGSSQDPTSLDPSQSLGTLGGRW